MGYRIQENNSIKHRGFSIIGLLIAAVGAIYFPIQGGIELYYSICSIKEDPSDTTEIWGAVYMVFWIMFCICLGIAAFHYACDILHIRDDGIWYKDVLERKKSFLPWGNVKDWGISYDSTSGGNDFHFYFSSRPLDRSEDGMETVDVEQADYYAMVFPSHRQLFFEHIIPYCEKHLDIPPFISPLFLSGNSGND